MLRLIIFLAAALSFVAAHSQPVPVLNAGQVDAFLLSLDGLSTLPVLDDTHLDDTWASDPNQMLEQMEAPFSSSIKRFRHEEQFEEALKIIKAHGFVDEEEWADVGDRTFRAYMALRMQETGDDIDEQMTETFQQIEASDMPENMKEQMRIAVEASRRLTTTLADVPKQDMVVVSAFSDRMDNLVMQNARPIE